MTTLAYSLILINDIGNPVQVFWNTNNMAIASKSRFAAPRKWLCGSVSKWCV